MPTTPSQFRFTAAELALMDRLGEKFAGRYQAKAPRATVLRVALELLAKKEGLLPKSNARKNSPNVS